MPGEDESLETEKRVLANAEKLYAAAMSAFDQLYEGGSSAEAALRAAGRNIEELARYDSRFQRCCAADRVRPRHCGRRRATCATTPKASTPLPSALPKLKIASRF